MTNKNIGLMAYLEESRFYHILITDYWLCQDKSVFFSIFTPQFIQYITFKTNKQTLKRNVPKKENPQYHVMWKYLKHTMQFSIWQDSSKTKIALKGFRQKKKHSAGLQKFKRAFSDCSSIFQRQHIHYEGTHMFSDKSHVYMKIKTRNKKKTT